jgi:hypothetical protein
MPAAASKKHSNAYDICIIGAGMAGLYMGTELLRMRPKLRIVIAEKYKFLGGRAMTYSATVDGVHYQWEEGAGRISENHRLLLGLVRRHGLTLKPIEGEGTYKESGAFKAEPDYFGRAMPLLLEPLERLPAATLAGTTIRKLFQTIHGARGLAILDHYPYRAEIDTMRADMALAVFRREMNSSTKFFVLAEGFSELVRKLAEEFREAGGTILDHHEFTKFTGEGEAEFKIGKPSEGIGRPELSLAAGKFIFAIPSADLGRIPEFRDLPVLKHIVMKPLLRVYAAFPLADREWLRSIPRTVTAGPLRFIIPTSYDKASLQISYTDSEDADRLIAIYERGGKEELETFVMKEFRTLFGPMKIPDPLFIQAYVWKDAVSYWLPGEYDPYEESRKACHPIKGKPWYVCGESFSTDQCWIEGALNHSQRLLGIIEKSL